VANAIVKRENVFRPLSCRTKPLVKAVRNSTLCGKAIKCIVTPNIDTPAWMAAHRHVTENYDPKYYTIVYVASFGYMNTNDLASMNYVRLIFPKALLVSVVHCKSADTDIPEEWLTRVKINSKMQFDSKIKTATTLLVHIAENLKLEINIETHMKELEQSTGPRSEVRTSTTRNTGFKAKKKQTSEKTVTPDLVPIDIKGMFLFTCLYLYHQCLHQYFYS